jgi:thioredoxin 1
MRSDGFKTVFELDGGIMKWRGANLPETTDNTVASNGMTKLQFDALLNSDKIVLIDFYADWCAPCKKMKPYLDEISKDMADKVLVIRINADDNQALFKELKIDALPVLQLYKNKTLTWTNTGFIDKAEVVKQLQ